MTCLDYFIQVITEDSKTSASEKIQELLLRIAGLFDD